MNDFTTIGFGVNDQIARSTSRAFKAENGKTYRVSLAWWEDGDDGKIDLDSASPKFTACKRIYHKDLGYVVCKSPEYEAVIGNNAKVSIGTILIQWPTDSRGKIDSARFNAKEWNVIPWVIAKDKYSTIGGVHEDWHLGSYDLKLKCTDDKFQKLTINNYPDSLLRKIVEGNPPLADELIAQIAAAAKGLDRVMARDLSLDDVREKLGGAPEGVLDSTTNIDVDAVVGNILG